MSRKKQPSEKPPKRVDRVLLVLLSISCLSFMVWAILSSLLAMHFRERVKIVKIDLGDEREIVKELRADIDLERTSVREDMLNANLLRREVGFLFRELLLKEERPASMTALLSRFQKVFGQLSGETLSRLEMIAIRDSLRILSGQESSGGSGEVLDAAGASAVLEHLERHKLIAPSDRDRVRSILLGETPSAPAAPPKPAAKPTPKPPPVKPAVVKPAPTPRPKPPPKPAAESPTQQGADWKSHGDKANGYSIKLPEKWSVRSSPGVAGFIAVSPRTDIRQLYTAYVALSVSAQARPDPIEVFYTRSVERIEGGLIDHERIEEKSLALSGVPARRLHLKHSKLGQPFHSIYYFCQHKGKSYVLSFTTPDNNFSTYASVFEKISGSLNFQ